MGGLARTEDWFNGWSIAASTLLHVVLFVVVLLLFVPPKISSPQEEEGVQVEFVTLPPPPIVEQQSELPRQPSLPERTEVVPDKAEENAAAPIVPQESQPHDETPAMVKPSRMLSEKVLADPRSRKARRELAALAPGDQIEQLCNLEAMAQVGAWSKEFQPDRVIAYALANPNLTANAFLAEGAALHSKREWSRLRFKCELTPDHKKVAGFEFLIGELIPKEDWAEYNLPEDEGSLD
ncbi:DUF930 domain-containing protein [Phyllobacterium sp. 22552]|uniref:DUF930 domain-containing protein n=1 Tax=Phyllobacterium sp. 22552 TaxID=3453941 RepID=UPI003F839294